MDGKCRGDQGECNDYLYQGDHLMLPLLPTNGISEPNLWRRVLESINGVLTFNFDDSRVATPAERSVGVTPVNPSYPFADLRRYGGLVNNPSAGAKNNAALNTAKLVTAADDAQMLVESGTWDFAEPISFAGTDEGARLVCPNGVATLRFPASIADTEDLVTIVGYNAGYIQSELRNITIECQGGGRRGLVLNTGDWPVIENVEVNDSGQDAVALSCSGFAWIENLEASIRVNDAGRHAFSFELSGSNGAFINECTFRQIEARGWSKRHDDGAFMYFNGTGSNPGSKFGNFYVQKSNMDVQWDTGDTFTPSAHAVVVDGSNSLEYIDFGTAGWENTGTGSISAGELVATPSTAVAAVHMRSFLRTGWVGGFGANVLLLTFEDNVNQRTQIGRIASLYNFPTRLQDTYCWERQATSTSPAQLFQKRNTTTAPASDDDGAPISGAIPSSVNISTSSTGNLDFPLALLASIPHAAFCQSFIVHLTGSQFAGSGNKLSQHWGVTLRPDGTLLDAVLLHSDGSTANMFSSPPVFSSTSRTLRAAISTGSAWGAGGGNTVLFGVCRTGGFLG